MFNSVFIVTLKESFSFRKNFLHIFRRPDHNLPPLDGLRALSVLYLTVFHTFFHLQFMVPEKTFLEFIRSFPKYLIWVWHGDKGVDVFFVLSGFLISMILMREYAQRQQINLKRFYLNRWLRLTPLYLPALLVTAILFNGQNIKYAWANLLYVNNLVAFKKMFMMWSWSQAVEQQFYILCPFFLMFVIFKTKYRWQAILVLLVASFVVRAFVIMTSSDILQHHMPELIFPGLKNFNPSYFDLTYFKLRTRFGPIVCGMLAAYLHLHHTDKLTVFFKKKSSLVNGIIVVIFAFNLLLLSIPYYSPHFTVSDTFKYGFLIAGRNVFSMGTAFIMMAALYPNGLGKAVGRFLSLKMWYPLSQLSYSIYLFHLLIGAVLYFAMIRLFGKPVNLEIIWILGAALLVLMVTLVFSVFVHAGIERPFMNLRKTS